MRHIDAVRESNVARIILDDIYIDGPSVSISFWWLGGLVREFKYPVDATAIIEKRALMAARTAAF
jgi:hypothetical protein